jgi:hypothetical protein
MGPAETAYILLAAEEILPYWQHAIISMQSLHVREMAAILDSCRASYVAISGRNSFNDTIKNVLLIGTAYPGISLSSDAIGVSIHFLAIRLRGSFALVYVFQFAFFTTEEVAFLISGFHYCGFAGLRFDTFYLEGDQQRQNAMYIVIHVTMF